MTRLGWTESTFSSGRRDKCHSRRRRREFADSIVRTLLASSVVGLCMGQQGCTSPCLCSPSVETPQVDAQQLQGTWMLVAETASAVSKYTDIDKICKGMVFNADGSGKDFLTYEQTSYNITADIPWTAYSVDSVTWQVLLDTYSDPGEIVGYFLHVRHVTANALVLYRCFPEGVRNAFSWIGVFARKAGSVSDKEIDQHMTANQLNDTYYVVVKYPDTRCKL